MTVQRFSRRHFRRREIIYAIVFGVLLAIHLSPDSVGMGLILAACGSPKENR